MARKEVLKLADQFDNTEAWLTKLEGTIKRLLETKEIKGGSLAVYISNARKQIAQKHFNAHRGIGYEAEFEKLSRRFPKEAFNWLSQEGWFKVKQICEARKCDLEKQCAPNPWKSALAHLPFMPAIYEMISFDRIQHGFQKNEKKKRELSRQEKLTPEHLLIINDPNGLMERVLFPLLDLKKTYPNEIVLPGLLLASGLRVADVYFGADVYFRDNMDYGVDVVSKLKLPLGQTEKKGFVPLLIPARAFVAHLQRFRKQNPNIETSEKASSSRGAINKRWCMKQVGSLIGNFTKPHNLRAVYAKLAYLLFGKTMLMTEATFVQFVLLHSSDRAALNYSGVIVNESTPLILPGCPYDIIRSPSVYTVQPTQMPQRSPVSGSAYVQPVRVLQ